MTADISIRATLTVDIRENPLTGEVNTPFDCWMTVGEVSHQLNVSTQRIQRYIGEGRLRYIRTTLGKLIDPEAVKLFAERKAEVDKLPNNNPASNQIRVTGRPQPDFMSDGDPHERVGSN